jgi:hypothetical protein
VFDPALAWLVPLLQMLRLLLNPRLPQRRAATSGREQAAARPVL